MTALLRAPALTRDQRAEALRHRVINRLDLRGLERPGDPLRYIASGVERYGEAFWHAEDLKQQLRLDYIRLTPPGPTTDAHAPMHYNAWDGSMVDLEGPRVLVRERCASCVAGTCTVKIDCR